MVHKIKLLVLPLVASALFFHNTSHSNTPAQAEMNPEQAMDQADVAQADVNLTDGATDNWGWWGGYGLGGAFDTCSFYPYLAGCLGGYGLYGYGLGYGGWGGGWWGGRGGWGGRGWGGRGWGHGRHH